MSIIKSYLTENPCFKSGKKIAIRGLMLHSVGVPQPKASVFIKSWNSPQQTRACVHAFIDANTGDVYQTLPWDARGWHSGGSGNNTHIGIEMCEPKSIKYVGGATFTVIDAAIAKKQATTTYNAAVNLFATLCDQFGLNPIAPGVVVSHAEGRKRGIASNHADPEHLWSQLGLPFTMDTFRRDVKKRMDGDIYAEEQLFRVRTKWADANSQLGAFKEIDNAIALANKNKGYSVFDSSGLVIHKGKHIAFDEYDVKIRVPNLNARSGPGTNYTVLQRRIPMVDYRILDEAKGIGASKWGKIRIGERECWISMDYAYKI